MTDFYTEDMTSYSGESDSAIAKRKAVETPEIESYVMEMRKTQLASIEAEMKALALMAMKTADTFKAMHMRYRENGSGAEKGGRYMCRARVRSEYQLEISWNEMIFVGAKGARRAIPKQIKKPREKMRHRKSDFSKCNDWESGAIEYAEDMFEMIRKRMATLHTQRSELKKLISN